MLQAGRYEEAKFPDATEHLRRDVWATRRITEALGELLFVTVRTDHTRPDRHPRHGQHLHPVWVRTASQWRLRWCGGVRSGFHLRASRTRRQVPRTAGLARRLSRGWVGSVVGER